MAASDEKFFDYWIRSRIAKSPVLLYTIIFLAVFLLINALNLMSNSPAISIGFGSLQKTLGKQETPRANEPTESSSFGEEIAEETDAEDEKILWSHQRICQGRKERLGSEINFQNLRYSNQAIYHCIFITES